MQGRASLYRDTFSQQIATAVADGTTSPVPDSRMIRVQNQGWYSILQCKGLAQCGKCCENMHRQQRQCRGTKNQ